MKGAQENVAPVHAQKPLGHERCERTSFVLSDLDEIAFVPARVPLIRFKQVHTDIEVDLNCNNTVGLLNTRLLYCYAGADWRVPQLMVVVKLWAKHHGINDTKNMSVSSYSLSLMVIHYLQCE
jgi:poly(A) RNA polymerase GLD2